VASGVAEEAYKSMILLKWHTEGLSYQIAKRAINIFSGNELEQGDTMIIMSATDKVDMIAFVH
jgi:hypothetical protein